MAMKVEKDLRMASGDGENSYAANSRTPEKAILENRPLLRKAIQGAYRSLSGERAMVVADLGCSSGPNTLLVVAEVLRTISSQNMADRRAVELQFFLNDLPSNDFNLIFQSLDQLQHLIAGKEEAGSKETAATPPPCYVAGLPGSFYKRLFPSESAHLFHSSYCLHWLTQVPYELSAGNYQNEGNIHIGKTTPQTVIKLFTEQFQNDFELFLTLRSEELVSGGRMLLTFLGRKGEPMLMHGEIGTMWELLTESLQSLVLKGRVDKEKLDSFNLPLYAPSADEVKAVINRTKLFDIEHIGMVEYNWDPQDDNLDDHMVPDPSSSGINVAKSIRAVLEPLIADHFGDDNIDELFDVYASIVAKHLQEGNAKCPSVVVSLKKVMH